MQTQGLFVSGFSNVLHERKVGCLATFMDDCFIVALASARDPPRQAAGYGSVEVRYSSALMCCGNKQVCYSNTRVRYDWKCLVNPALVLGNYSRSMSHDSTQASYGSTFVCYSNTTQQCAAVAHRCTTIRIE